MKEKQMRIFAKMIAGLQVPISMDMPLGTAKEAFIEIKEELNLFGWFDEEQIFEALKKAQETVNKENE